MPQLIGLVLAGGAGARLGRDKGGLELGGRTLADAAAQTLSPLCGSVLISVGPDGRNPAPEFRTVQDAPPAGRGPLAGIAAAFAATGGADLLVLACDYPRVGTRLLQHVVRGAHAGDQLVFVTDPAGRDHPLVGLWRRSAEAAVGEALEHGFFKVRALLPELEVRRLGPPELGGFDLGRLLLNVNRPEDLRRAEDELRPDDPAPA